MGENYQDAFLTNQPVRSDEIYAEMLQEERVKNTIAQTSPDNQLQEIEYRIRGFKKNLTTQQWELINPNSNAKYKVSDILIERYMAQLSSIVNDGQRFSNYSSMEINNVMCIMIEWLVDDLESNSDLYNLKGNYTERTRIGLMFLNYTFAVLKRCQDGKEAKMIWKSLNLNENMNMGSQPQSKGLMDKLQFWKKN